MTEVNRHNPGGWDQQQPRILVADDEKVVRDLLERFLTRKGYEVLLASDGAEAMDLFRHEHVDLVLSDLRMPGLDGLQLLKAIKDANPRMPVVLISGYGEVATVVEALKHGAENFLAKPLKMNDLSRVVEQSLSLTCLQRAPIVAPPDIEQTTRIKVASNPEHICELVYLVALSATAVGFCQHDLDNNVKLALVEAATNAMEHGNRWDMDKSVAMVAVVTGDEVRVTITDEGEGFEVADLPDPTDPAQLTHERGRGVFLMRSIMDEVTFNAAANSVTMVKRKSGQQAACDG